jgi:hypothetical protein
MLEHHSSSPEQPMRPAVDISELVPEQAKPIEDEARVEYKNFTGYKRKESSEQLRTRYLRYTGELIKKIVDEDIDTVVYLDKSARPVQWLVSAMWDHYMPDKPRPNERFVNIDRDDWRPALGSPTYGDYRPEELDISAKQELRDIFADPDNPDRTQFDGKRILIVDEVQVSGDTLRIAEDIFKQAFPTAEVTGAWWMIPAIPQDDGSVDVPVWYRQDTSQGRGIDNKDREKSLASPSRAQQVGATFLSTRPDQPDSMAQRLRAEIRQLRKDVDAGIQRVIPLHRD